MKKRAKVTNFLSLFGQRINKTKKISHYLKKRISLFRIDSYIYIICLLFFYILSFFLFINAVALASQKLIILSLSILFVLSKTCFLIFFLRHIYFDFFIYLIISFIFLKHLFLII